MMRILWIAAIVLLSFATQPPTAQASEAPWCAVVDTGVGSVHWDCQYRSVEECAPVVVAGNRGTCNPSPYYQGPTKPQKRAARHRSNIQ